MSSRSDDGMEMMELSQISEDEERMMMFNVYIIGSVSITLSIIILYSLIKQLKKENDKYYKYALKCGIISSICLLIFYLLKICFNDLIIPINLVKNIDFVSIIDSFLVLLYLTERISFYYGFTFIYQSLFKNKENIDKCSKILMVFIVICAISYGVLYLIDDLLATSFKEIGITKRGIYTIMYTGKEGAESVYIVALFAILSDLIYVGLLLYRYIYDVKHVYNDVDIKNGVKGVILITISSITFIITLGSAAMDSNIKWLIAHTVLLSDNICLFLMFRDNQEIYQNLCGCLCNKCCLSLCFASKYKQIQNIDQDDDEQDDQNNQQL